MSSLPKNIFITGASSGFGKLAVESLLRNGHSIIAGVRGGDERLKQIFPADLLATGRLFGIDLHMEKSQSFPEASEKIKQIFHGKLDVLINNAGYGLYGPFETQTEEQIRHQFEVNFFGAVFHTRALLPLLRQARGKIINVSSIAGLASFPFYGAYNASKHALDGFSEALYYDLKPFGVQVALIEPGGFKTEFLGQNLSYGKDPRFLDLYQEKIAAFQAGLGEKNKKFSGDPRKVVQLMVKLVEAEKIPLRSAIGRDAHLILWVKRLLPDQWRVNLVDWAFRKFIFRH